jgi:ATP-dependent DNA helicase RecG
MSTGQRNHSLPPPASSRSYGLNLDDPLKYLKGVGGQALAALGKLDLRTVRDLLRHVPRRWDDRTRFRPVADVQNGETVSLRGVVSSTETKRPKPQITVTEVILNDDGAALKLVWFNQPYLEKTFKALAAAKKTVIVYGQVKRAGWTPEIQNPEWEELSEEGDNLSAARIVPVYPSTAGLRQTRLRHIIHEALQRYSHLLAEPLPPELALRHKLIGVQAAITQIHFPDSLADLEAARKRLVFE